MSLGSGWSRVVAALAVCLAAACGTSGATANDEVSGGDGEEPGRGSAAQCSVAADCEPAGATCCDCPSFAVPVADGVGAACDSVECDPGATCSTLAEPACIDGGCDLRCAPVRLAPGQTCSMGFVRDELGCLTPACFVASPDEPGCGGDGECVQVPADCCGCQEGGRDTAVRSADAESHIDGLGCNGTPTCPGVNVCDTNMVPRCLGGQCQLVSSEPDDDGGQGGSDRLCGTDAFEPCAAGEVCVLNDPDSDLAAEYGVGICRPE